MAAVTEEALGKGARLQRNGETLVSRGVAINGLVQLFNPQRRTTQYIAMEKILAGVMRGRIIVLAREASVEGGSTGEPTQIPADLSTLDEEDRNRTLRRLAYVREVHAHGLIRMSGATLKPVIADAARKLTDARPPHWRTVIDWVKWFEESQVAGLMVVARGNTHSRLDDHIEDLIYISITTHYMQLTRPDLKLTLGHLQGLIEQENKVRDPDLALVAPSYTALRRRVSEFDPFELMCARMGRQYAVNWFRTRGQAPRASRAFEVIQVDHTVFDAEVTFKGILRLGKPTLTIARDQFTGGIVGYYLGFEPPGYVAVMNCLVSTVLRKSGLNSLCPQLNRAWEMFGAPETLMVDNGREFQGHDLKNACHHLGIDITYSPPRKPWFKPHVERMFGVLRQKLGSRLRGRTFTAKEEKGDYKVEEEPLIDLEDLERLLVKWIVDVCNESPYAGTGIPPRIAWERSIKEHPPRVDFKDEEVRVYCGKTARRSLRSYGVELLGLYFASDELSALRRHLERSQYYAGSSDRKDRRLLIKYNPLDLGRLWVLDPIAGLYVEAKAVDFQYADGLSLHRHRLNVSYARKKNAGAVDAAALVRANAEIDQMIASMSLTDAERLGGALARAIRSEKPEIHDLERDLDNADSPEDPVLSAEIPAKTAAKKKPPRAPKTEPAPEVIPENSTHGGETTPSASDRFAELAAEWTT